MKNPRWNILDKLSGVLLFVALIFGGIYVSVPSSLFVRTISLSYDEQSQHFTFVRHVSPLLSLKITAYDESVRRGHAGRWWATITLIDGDEFECSSGAPRSAFYQYTPGNAVTYTVDDWAQPCLDAGPPFYITIHRRVLLFGVIPLYPSLSESGIGGGLRDAPPILE